MKRIVLLLSVSLIFGMIGAVSCSDGEADPDVPPGSGSGRFVDNGDGTVTDNQTGLMWEKKNATGGGMDLNNPHDVDNEYTWSASGTAPDGTVFVDFIGRLNNCTSSDGSTISGGFAGHCDWRLPQIDELRGILDFSGVTPLIDPIFGPVASGPNSDYLSGTTDASDARSACFVNFADGGFSCSNGNKLSHFDSHARAVRTGPRLGF